MVLELWVFIILVCCSSVFGLWVLSLIIIFVLEVLEKIRAKSLQVKLQKEELKNAVKQLQKDYSFLEELVINHDVLLRMRKKGKKKK